MPTFPCTFAQTDRPEYSKNNKNISNYGVMQVQLLSRYIMGFAGQVNQGQPKSLFKVSF